MRLRRALIGTLALACSACDLRLGTVEVRVLPKHYEIGGVRSELATPAVDEVVRQRPSEVIIWTCMTTPPEKVSQFRKELIARHEVPMRVGFLKEGCT